MRIVKFFRVNQENGYMSNWWLCNFTIDGVSFNSVEQYMMWSKAKTFNDEVIASKIMQTSAMADIKRLGREVHNYDEKVWGSIREEVVYRGVLAKFSQNEDLKSKLLSFDKDSIFCECSPYDRIWGIGLSASNPSSNNQNEWRGRNLLGKCIGRARKELN